MKRQIIWSDDAEEDYANNIEYLLAEWTVNDAQEFVDNADNVIRIITEMPKSFPPSDYKKVRKALICKQISLLYQIKKSEIILLRFWNNLQDPEKLKL